MRRKREMGVVQRLFECKVEWRRSVKKQTPIQKRHFCGLRRIVAVALRTNELFDSFAVNSSYLNIAGRNIVLKQKEGDIFYAP